MSALGWFTRRPVAHAVLVAAIPICTGLLVPATLEAQRSASGRVRGLVSDSLRQPLAGARVELSELSMLAPTDLEGRFELPPLSPGAYHLRVAYIGFLPDTESVVVRPGQATAVS